MIDIFSKRYLAVSNAFVTTIEGDVFVYPAPLSVHGTIEDESKSTKSRFEFHVSSYTDSFLALNSPHSIFLYLLSMEYTIDTLYIQYLRKEEVRQEVGGYKGIYDYVNQDVAMNMSIEEVSDAMIALRRELNPIEIVTD
ncbi:hypothetical protein [Chroococcidiopsis sp.]|uniref:hypothetical protein n=1 Tax=Chroococcidiopsis sp. TaxID=3088168 RepID=UPI003F363837